MSRVVFVCLFITSILFSCGVRPKGDFGETTIPNAPDYSKMEAWAALPSKQDNADKVPANKFPNNQETAKVDVFFLHPTTYTGSKGHKLWNGPIDDEKLNAKTDEGTIMYQASIFNGAGKIYAPRYRQAHLHAYYSEDKKTTQQAFDLAYSDIKAAFEYYLEHYNKGKPIILACHSQGTTHGGRLLKEFFDGKALQDKLVAAYLVGIPVPKDYFDQLKPCETPKETGCFCTWRSYKKGKYPKTHDPNNTIIVTNPLSWNRDTKEVPKTKNEGGVLLKFDKVLPELTSAQIHQGLLWLEKPKFPGSFLYFNPNYHIADYNLYYVNVRKNAIERVEAFFSEH